MWSRIMPIHPKKMIYLKPTLANCQERVNTRARDGEIVKDRTEDTKNDNDSTGGGEEAGEGGVSAAYQRLLVRAHDSFLLGMHLKEFPNMPPRPHKDDVVLVDGSLADDDFSRPGPAQERVTEFIVSSVLSGTTYMGPANSDHSTPIPSTMATNAGTPDFVAWAATAAEQGRGSTSVEECLVDPDADNEQDEVDQVLNGLLDLYKDKHGEDPTDEMVSQWVKQLREATAEAATEDSARIVD